MIDFGSAEQMRYLSRTETVNHYVYADGQRVNCRVSKEFLSDEYGMTNEDPLEFAQLRFDQLTDAWGQLISIGAYEAKNSVLLRSS